MWASIQDQVITLWADHWIRAAVVVLGSLAAAYLSEFIIRHTIGAMVAKTRTDIDDKLLAVLRRPVFWTICLVGLAWAASLSWGSGRDVAYAVLKTTAVLIWTVAGIRMGMVVLESLSNRARDTSIIQPRTLPVFDMMTKIIIVSAACYFTFLAWNINVSAWLASAGIVGIAVGFAAKDTLANLFAGIFIMADSIYKVGDFIVLSEDGGFRGRVTRIGMRSTRILTLDEVEITVPNSIIGNGQIINEVAGPSVRQRIHAKVSVAYGSDLDQVFSVLSECADGVEGVCAAPRPEIRFYEFGGSGLELDVLVYITEPAERDRIISRLNVRIYKLLGAAGIEIPYSKHDVYIKQISAARLTGAPPDGAPGNQPE